MARGGRTPLDLSANHDFSTVKNEVRWAHKTVAYFPLFSHRTSFLLIQSFLPTLARSAQLVQ